MNRFKILLIIGWVGIIGLGVGIPGVVAGDLVDSQKIVTFYEDVPWSEVESYAADWGPAGVSVVMELPIFNCLILKVPPGVTDTELVNDERVEKIEDDQSFGIEKAVQGQFAGFIEAATELPQDHYPWGILKLYGRDYDPWYLTSAYDPNDRTGHLLQAFGELNKHQIRIAVFDTGVYFLHENLNDIIKGGIDLVNNENLTFNDILSSSEIPLDDNGHGTYIAGIISAALDPEAQWGRNSPIELYAVKILNEYAMGDISNIIMGLQWAIIHNIDIVNMSVGYRSDSPSIRRAIRVANAFGLIMIASTGNHSNWDDSVILAADGGAADGGAADGGAADGGAADGGAADGGAADGGAADGGAADGGAADGGAADGGAADGGAADGGAADGGAADGGAADGGAADGGAADGGAADGGAADGGAADGGAADGGAADGGAADGGAADGGAAGGSSDLLPEFSVMYPARYADVIAVGATTPFGELADYTNSGLEMDILAPGSGILSADVTNGDLVNGFGFCNGTSQAAAHITAAAALMLAMDPSLGSEDIKNIMRDTARAVNSEWAGEISLSEALKTIEDND